MLIAPTRSALSSKPHFTHSNRAWVWRLSLAMCPQHGHVRLIFSGGTGTRCPPFHARLSPILAGVPKAQNVDGCVGDLIAQLIITYDHAPHIAGREFFDLDAQLRIGQELRGAGDELPDDLRSGVRVYRGREIMQADEIALGTGGPLQGHG
jgi:hypothetical protein